MRFLWFNMCIMMDLEILSKGVIALLRAPGSRLKGARFRV